MASDVVISVAGAMPGDGRQRAEEQQSLVLSQLSFEWERFGPGTIEWVGVSHGKQKTTRSVRASDKKSSPLKSTDANPTKIDSTQNIPIG